MLRFDPIVDATLPHWIGRRAVGHGDRVALTFLDDDGGAQSWTYRQLWQRACEVAARLPAVDGTSPRGLLLFPPGIDFLAGFLGCQIAGWVPVPACYPRAGRPMPRLDSVARDCEPSAIIGNSIAFDSVAFDKLCQEANSIPRVVADADSVDHAAWVDPDSLAIDSDALAMLQYTSGSTSQPRGVMVRHRNLMANLESIRRGFGIEWQGDAYNNADHPEGPAQGRGVPDCGVFWLPFFHDMGLIGGILEPLYVGGHTVLMSPRSFLQRPVRWLQCISDYRAAISGAPNFAYQLAVDRISPEQTDGLDLGCWRIAFCGAEPIRQRTLEGFATRFSSCGFSASAFYPCYGLAEATLLAAGGEGPGELRTLKVERNALCQGIAKVVDQGRGREFQTLVSCGGAAHQTELAVVDPKTSQLQSDCRVGEIWLRGAGISAGYWKRDRENQTQFNATLADGRSGFFRSGDLGFLHQGQLYVTGRLKDVIILRGRNHFPQDIEITVSDVIGNAGGQCAAFAVDGPRSEALAIVAELPRQFDQSKLPELVRAIRREVIDVHEVDPRHVLLVRQATIPRTSSGKVQRSACRELLSADKIKTKYRYDRSSASEQVPIAIPDLPPEPTMRDRQSMILLVQSWMTQWLVARAGVRPSDIAFEKPFADYGLDSMTAVEMSGEIEDWSGVGLTPVVAWDYPTISLLSGYIVDQLIGAAQQHKPDRDLPNAESSRPKPSDLAGRK